MATLRVTADQNTEAPAPHTAAGRYEALTIQRKPFLDRAREVAEVTIPSIMPPEGIANGQQLYTPFQSAGSSGVNNLASKLLLALFPPGEPFFRLRANEFDLNQFEAAGLGGEEAKSIRVEIEKALGETERSISQEMESRRGLRSTLFESLKHIVVAGNVLLRSLPQPAEARMYPLSQYVVVRDNEGALLEIIVKEELSRRTLPQAARLLLESKAEEDKDKAFDAANSDERSIALYTRIVRRSNKWLELQELEGMEVPNTRRSYKLDANPWLPLRLIRIDGESYGRGRGEEMLGDLQSLESMSQSVVDYGAAASKILFMIEPGSSTNPDDLFKPSGSVITGDPDEVGVLALEKFADMRFVFELMQTITRRLDLAFLSSAAVQRDAERVTAEEIRFLAQELEDGLGGVYSILSQELQLSLVRVVMSQMQAAGKLPKLDLDDDVSLQVITGLEALGRNRDLRRQEQLIRGMAELFGPEAINDWVIVGEFMRARSTALGLDSDGFLRTQEQVTQLQQARAQQALVEKGAPNAVNQVGETVRAQQTQQ